MSFLSSIGVLWEIGGRRVQEWQRFGEMTGLVFTGECTHATTKGQEVMGGTFGNYQVRLELCEDIQVSYNSSHRHNTYSTRMTLYPNSKVRASLQISSEGLGTKFLKKLGGQDLEIGVKAFDDKFRIRASDPSLPRRVLTPQVQDWLLWVRGAQAWSFSWSGRAAVASTGLADWNADIMLYVLEVLQTVTEQLETLYPPDRKEGKDCPGCGGKLEYVAQYDRWYCYHCQQYASQGAEAQKREERRRTGGGGSATSYSLSSIKGK